MQSQIRIDEDGEPLAYGDPNAVVRGEPADITVDGAPVSARMLRDIDVLACAIQIDTVDVIVAARNVDPPPIYLERVRDLDPFKAERLRVVAEHNSPGTST